jgi:hypothetical protein
MDSVRQILAATLAWSADKAVQIVIEVHHGYVLAVSEGDVRF